MRISVVVVVVGPDKVTVVVGEPNLMSSVFIPFAVVVVVVVGVAAVVTLTEG